MYKLFFIDSICYYKYNMYICHMEKHLQSAVDRDKRKKYLITPICKSDAEIISGITKALELLEIDDLRNIIEQWKYLKDEEIYDLIDNWLKNYEIEESSDEDDSDKEKEDVKRKFVQFEGTALEITLIKRIDTYEDYNYDINKMEYYIVINKDFPENMYISDLKFKFTSDQQRKNKLDYLRKHLSKFIKIV